MSCKMHRIPTTLAIHIRGILKLKFPRMQSKLHGLTRCSFGSWDIRLQHSTTELIVTMNFCLLRFVRVENKRDTDRKPRHRRRRAGANNGRRDNRHERPFTVSFIWLLPCFCSRQKHKPFQIAGKYLPPRIDRGVHSENGRSPFNLRSLQAHGTVRDC